MTKEERGINAINKAKAKHPNLYGYDLIDLKNYVGAHVKVPILCFKCNKVFYQTMGHHTFGTGCPDCGIVKRANSQRKKQEEFLIDAHEVHGDLYGYIKTKYTLESLDVTITCKTHGDFDQTPHNHLQGSGCPECGRISSSIARTKTHEEFLLDAFNIHGEMFDYSLDKYIADDVYFKLRCNTCKLVFDQIPSSHLQGTGCPKCADTLPLTNESFIEKATKIHGDMFNYSLINILGYKKKISIKCNACGLIFLQTPSVHLCGCGCPECKSSKNERVIMVYLKKNNIPYVTQKQYTDLIGLGGGRLKFDFYIPSKDLLIEFDGQQHFGLVNMGRYTLTPEEYSRLQEHDKRKNEYAIRNNIKLLRIPYWNSKKIGTILDNEFGIIH